MERQNDSTHTSGSFRFLLSRRDWAYVLSLLLPFVVYDLVLKASLVKAAVVFSGREASGIMEGLGLMRSDLLFSLAYVLLWVGLFAMARKGTLRRIVVVLFHAVTILIALLVTSAYQYFKITGSTLDSDYLLLWLSSPDGTGDVIASEITPGILVLLLAVVTYALLGPPLVTRLVGRWRGWSDADAQTTAARTGQISWLRLIGVGLAMYALFSFSLLPGGGSSSASESFARDPIVNMVTTAAEAAESGGLSELAAEPVEPSPEASLVPTAESERRNVVLIFLESERAGATTPYNGNLETTPFMDELAKSSILAERAYTVVPHSHNALTATNCGVDPPLGPWGTKLLGSRDDAVPSTCLADLLKEQGYDAAYFTSQTAEFENSPKVLENLGYEEFYSVEGMETEGFEKANYFAYEDDVMLEPSESWLREQKKSGKPFLVSYLTGTAHHEYLAPQERYGREEYTDNDVVNRYLNSVRYQDIFLKNLFDQYKELGLYEDTVFVVIGDHGEAFGEHGRFQHDNVPYEEGLRVPMLVHDPRWCPAGGCEEGGRIEEPVNQLDILPTVADLLGYRIQGGAYVGSSLFRPLPEDRTLMSSCWNEKGCLASVKGTDKYVYHFDDRAEEVFDLSKDPQERNNIAGQYSEEELERKRRELLDWRARVNATYYASSSEEEGDE